MDSECGEPGSESKILVGIKREAMETEETSESSLSPSKVAALNLNVKVDPMTVWEGLKQNNYMSARCGIPLAPVQKTRRRKKNNNDNGLMKKKKMVPVKKEPVDRFARVAEPSGLLIGLKPGIINHVRNKEQVHSIIGALVGSEICGDRGLKIKGADGIKNGAGELTEYAQFSQSNSCMENGNDLSAEGSGSFKSVTSLSFDAVNVASQWLELLNQDIRGRISALRRSKKRVQAVMTTNLPGLMSWEFPTNHPERDTHAVRWSTMFGQMDNALSEEEINLKNWLNQVKEMQLHCDRDLRNSLCNASMGNNCRSGEDDSENPKDLDVDAACNLLLTMENSLCC